MVELGLVDRIGVDSERVGSALKSYNQFLRSSVTGFRQNFEHQLKLGRLKDQLRELEEELTKTLTENARKEAKRIAINESLSVLRSKTEELTKIVQDQKARRDESTLIMSQQSISSEEKNSEDTECAKGLEESTAWYHKVLGFHIEGGHGVKFIFNKINKRNPDEEYTFTIRHEHDIYTLLKCDPPLDDIKDLIKELNHTNSLFKFVRTMRERFQATAFNGVQPASSYAHGDSSTITLSSPPSPVSASSGTDSYTDQSGVQPRGRSNAPTRKINHSQVSTPSSSRRFLCLKGDMLP
ncbi:hypothetical protein QJS04_geneDACA002769 [Acorus gramineus]|uniref:Kinetochore protein SPC25 n=1 Tax=Acorus gramineus TaxID=55184 RepID=A0AAV9BVN2_ACOGR|nr:hypothetical protein QJS04_geneDACA002769 [Acorus gramineus]